MDPKNDPRHSIKMCGFNLVPFRRLYLQHIVVRLVVVRQRLDVFEKDAKLGGQVLEEQRVVVGVLHVTNLDRGKLAFITIILKMGEWKRTIGKSNQGC